MPSPENGLIFGAFRNGLGCRLRRRGDFLSSEVGPVKRPTACLSVFLPYLPIYRGFGPLIAPLAARCRPMLKPLPTPKVFRRSSKPTACAKKRSCSSGRGAPKRVNAPASRAGQYRSLRSARPERDGVFSGQLKTTEAQRTHRNRQTSGLRAPGTSVVQ